MAYRPPFGELERARTDEDVERWLDRMEAWERKYATGPEDLPFFSARLSEPFGRRAEPVAEPEPESPKPYEREVLRPWGEDREEWLRRARWLYDQPRVPIHTPDCAPGVIPFGWAGGHNTGQHLVREREERKAYEGLRAEKAAMERLRAQAWTDGEWCDDMALARAIIDPEAVRRDMEREARQRRRDAERKERREIRTAWCEDAYPDFWPESNSEWCNVDAIAWCLDEGGGWCSGEDGWSQEWPESWCDDDWFDWHGFEAAAWCGDA